MLILVSCLVLNLCVSAQLVNSEFKTLVWNNSHVVSYEIGERNVIFRLEAIADYTDDSESAVNFDKRDFVSIRVDANNNNRIDKRMDLAFGIRSGSSRFCPQFLYDAVSSSACGQQRSEGRLKITFGESPFTRRIIRSMSSRFLRASLPLTHRRSASFSDSTRPGRVSHIIPLRRDHP